MGKLGPPMQPREVKKRLLQLLLDTLGQDFAIGNENEAVLVRERQAEIHDVLTVKHVVHAKGGTVYCTVDLSIHCPRLEELLSNIRGVKPNRFAGCFAVNIGYLGPANNWQSWPFDRGAFPDSTGADLVDTVAKYAPRFWCEFASLQSVYDGCRRLGLQEANQLQLPALMHLLGNDDEAVRLLERSLAGIRNQQHSAAQDFRLAANRLGALLRPT